jgi:hypothetical protein
MARGSGKSGREAYLANRDRVTRWPAAWPFPEVDWPDVPGVAIPAGMETDERRWLAEVAPWLPEYSWILQARPRNRDVAEVVAVWQFGGGHRFEMLDVRIVCATDPEYISERLATGAQAAGLKGWRDDDLRQLYVWLVNGIAMRPLGDAVRGSQRLGFTRFDMVRFAHSRTEFSVQLKMSATTVALDGSPLNEHGEPVYGR